VYVYQFVAEQCGTPAGAVFSISDAKVPPSMLAAMMMKHTLFSELGYLMANAR
jgi:hypothetical protein